MPEFRMEHLRKDTEDGFERRLIANLLERGWAWRTEDGFERLAKPIPTGDEAEAEVMKAKIEAIRP